MQLSLPARMANPLGIILAFLLSFSLFQGALASPTPFERSLAKRYEGTPSGKQGDGGPDTTDYPSDDDIRSAYTSPSGSSVFFSQIGGSDPAYQYAQQNKGFIFRGAYPDKYTVRNKRSKQWYQDFADRFSGVFAEKASGEVILVSDFKNVIDDCRVWNRIEFPTIKQNSGVSKVTLVDYTDFSNTKTIWERDLAERDFNSTLEERSAELQKRASACFDWDGYGDDPDDSEGSDDGGDDAYAPGWCTVHITQYQKNEGSGDTSEYRYDVDLYDANGETVGGSDLVAIADGATADFDSALPAVFEVTSGSVDSDAVYMAYNGQSWSSDDQPHDCNFGSYDSGNRDGNCGFTC